MRVRTSELEGVALDWAVAKCEGFDSEVTGSNWGMWGWATDWAQGGPIIERGYLFLAVYDGVWEATKHHVNGAGTELTCEGETPLIAAMRCYVASKLGDEVEVPNELQPPLNPTDYDLEPLVNKHNS